MLCLIAVGLLILYLSPASAQAKTSFEFNEVVYHTCYDGDTCMVSLPGIQPFFGDHILIRLEGIDTPEIKGVCERENQLAREARNFLRGVMEQASTIRLINAHRDKYFRIDAMILADGVDVSELMINKGYAVRYDGGTKKNNWCGLKELVPSKDVLTQISPSTRRQTPNR
jgi:endonuclease YncB( thermonuclease family)